MPARSGRVVTFLVRIRQKPGVTLFVSVLLVIAGIAVGCSETEADSEPDASLDASTDVGDIPCPDRECDDGKVCYRGGCYASCDDDGDCDDEHRCWDGHCAPKDCQGIECDEKEACYRGVCYPSCQDDADCGDEASCTDSACVDSCEEIECPSDEVCYFGACFDTCEAQADCDGEDRCDDGRCAPPDCDDIDCPDDQVCYHGTCYPYCVDEDDCESEAQCEDSACIEPSCDDGLVSGEQTDVDCGGPNCPSCDIGQSCLEERDCVSELCEDEVCVACIVNEDCDDGEICDNNICLPEDGCTSDDQCDDGDDCTNSVCVDGDCEHDAFCDGSDDQCGCTSCTDCTSSDGWYDVGLSYDCCDGDQACICQDQQYRSYFCSGTSCDYNVTNTRTVESGCTTCDDGDSCTASSCSGGTCQHNAYCSGTDSDCGCTTCTDCSADDGWYDVGSSYDCCDSGQACNCQDQQYRTYSCSGTGCEYSVTNTQTVSSECITCDDGNICTTNDCEDGTCINDPDPSQEGEICGPCDQCNDTGLCVAQCDFGETCCEGGDLCLSDGQECP